MRQVVLDTETTGLEFAQGHRVIEIGCVELLDRRLTGNNYHQYLQPDRDIDPGAAEVHGINNAFLADKPRFVDVVDELLEYLGDAELIIHNAPFDTGFLNNELTLAGLESRIEVRCNILDTLDLARQLHPGQKNSLDALCRRYHIDNSHRELHGALLDAEILAEVYLAMTGGQVSMTLSNKTDAHLSEHDAVEVIRRMDRDRAQLRVIKANSAELDSHKRCLRAVSSRSALGAIWKSPDDSDAS